MANENSREEIIKEANQTEEEVKRKDEI
jgi:hypothetical protein